MTEQASRHRVTYRHPAVIGTVGTLLALLLVFILIEQDVIEIGDLAGLRHAIGHALRSYGPAASLGALYAEESGVPLPVPGDFFLMFAGRKIHAHPELWLVTWLAFILVVVLGSTNLYFISRKWGRPLVVGRVGRAMHVTPRRVARAEQWFQRYGVLALIFGRHIIGLRVPITVAAGVLRVSYPVFAASVAVSTAIWAGIFLTVGIKFGGSISGFIEVHRWLYVAVPLFLVSVFLIYLVRGLLQGPAEA